MVLWKRSQKSPPLVQVAGNVSLGDFIKEKQSVEKDFSFLLNKKTC